MDGNGALRIYDLTDPSGLIALGRFALQGVLDVKVFGNFAYLACGDRGLRVWSTLAILTRGLCR